MRWDVSLGQLLEQIGFNDRIDELTRSRLAECLAQYPEAIDECEGECADIRGGGGWYFGRNERGAYIVGIVGGSMRVENIQTFPSRTEACAEYLRQTVLARRSGLAKTVRGPAET